MSLTGHSGEAMIGLSRTCHSVSPHVHLKIDMSVKLLNPTSTNFEHSSQKNTINKCTKDTLNVVWTEVSKHLCTGWKNNLLYIYTKPLSAHGNEIATDCT